VRDDGASDSPNQDQQKILAESLAEDAEVAGDIAEIGSDAWVIHGHIPVDGEVIMADYGSFEEASAALGSLPPNEEHDLGEP
jgi:hypothetical protein